MPGARLGDRPGGGRLPGRAARLPGPVRGPGGPRCRRDGDRRVPRPRDVGPARRTPRRPGRRPDGHGVRPIDGPLTQDASTLIKRNDLEVSSSVTTPSPSASIPLVSTIFGVTYLALALGKVPGLRIDRSGIALVGAAAMLGCGVLSMGDAAKAVDYETI